ncbi:MAG: hydrogenase 4 subunit B [Sphingomonas sp.]|jgi:formate hydrogenlyase subunit 3/multisubunit Na+/H+ antiporter MnhD subunit|uniref:hydrogenase 4 subunit B n=1 Tax=Sphingomonas sp. TaxID=28214 RepID=UPI003564DE47
MPVLVPVVAILWCIAALLVTGAIAVAIGRLKWARWLIYGSSLTVCMMACAIAITHLIADPASVSEIVLPLGLPWIGANFRIDALAAFFLVVINLGGAAASLYGLGYGSHETAPERVLPFFPLFLAGMNLVLLASDAFTFLLSWESMSLASWALVMTHHREEENRKAGYVYIVMASFGTLALLLAFGLMAGPDGGYAFATMRAHGAPPGLAGLVLVLALLGTGSKAGLVPLHVWLPLAHPAAPSHVSALMSGVMTKVAVYGFIRITFDLLGPVSWWWAVPVLFAGAITAVLGVLTALMQNDIKRVLAYSTIENIGLIFVAIGLALAFQGNGMKAAAALAMTAALFHVLNHALFKSLLFFGAGAVLNATGERRMETLGGLLNRMPATGLLFLVGAVAISALPPLNGFASEWLMLQAILLSPGLPQWALKLLIPAVGAMLALSAALAAACFVRAFGISFLGRPRSPAASNAHEVDRLSIAAMAILAVLCLLAGIFPALIIDALAPVASALTGARMPVQTHVAWLSIVPIAESRSSYNGLLVFLFIAASASFAAFAIHRFASARLRRAPAWDCGFPDASPVTQYTADSFAQPVRRVFGGFAFRATEVVDMPSPGDGRPARLSVTLHDLAWDLIYDPIVRLVAYLAERLNHLQFLTIRRYLSLVFGALILLLLILAAWP